MSYDASILAQGQLPSVEATLYTCPAGKTAVIRRINIVNKNTTTELVNVYVRQSGGTSRLCMPMDMELKTRESAEQEDITLSEGDVIRGHTTSVTVVDYTIHGVVRTP